MFLFLAVPRSIIPRFNLTLRGSELILASPKEFQAIGLQGPEPSIVVRACHRGHVDCAIDVDQRNVQHDLINQGALLVGVGILEGFTSNLANDGLAIQVSFCHEGEELRLRWFRHKPGASERVKALVVVELQLHVRCVATPRGGAGRQGC